MKIVGKLEDGRHLVEMTAQEYEAAKAFEMLLPAWVKDLESVYLRMLKVVSGNRVAAPIAPAPAETVRRKRARGAGKGMKTCTECGREKPSDDYYPGNGKCKSCYKARQKVRDYERAERKRKSAGAAAANDPELSGHDDSPRRRPHPGGPDAFEGLGAPIIKGRLSRVGG